MLLEREEVDQALYIATEGGFFAHSKEERKPIPRILRRILQLHRHPERNKRTLDRLSPGQRARILNLTEGEQLEIDYCKDLITYECLLDDSLQQVKTLRRHYRQAIAALRREDPPEEEEEDEVRET